MARRNDIELDQTPRLRVDPRWQERQARKFSIASTLFAATTLLFLFLLVLSALTGVELIFNIGIAIVFLIWFPCLLIAARNAKYYDPWGLEEMLRENR